MDKNEIQKIADSAPELEYKPNFKEVVERGLTLVNGKKGALICTNYPRGDTPKLDLTLLDQIDFNNDPFLHIRQICDYWDKAIHLYNELPDDRLPSASLNFGTGIWAGMLNNRMHFSDNTSWVHPWADSLDGLLDLTFPEKTDWFKIFMEGMNIWEKGVTIAGVSYLKLILNIYYGFTKVMLSSGFGNPEKVKKFVKNEKACNCQLFDSLGGGIFHSRSATMDIIEVDGVPISKVGRKCNPNPRLKRVV